MNEEKIKNQILDACSSSEAATLQVNSRDCSPRQVRQGRRASGTDPAEEAVFPGENRRPLAGDWQPSRILPWLLLRPLRCIPDDPQKPPHILQQDGPL